MDSNYQRKYKIIQSIDKYLSWVGALLSLIICALFLVITFSNIQISISEQTAINILIGGSVLIITMLATKAIIILFEKSHMKNITKIISKNNKNKEEIQLSLDLSSLH